MTGAKGTGRKANNNASQSPIGSQSRRAVGFETLCTNVDDLCNSAVDNDDEVIPRIQEMLREQPGSDLIRIQPQLWQSPNCCCKLWG